MASNVTHVDPKWGNSVFQFKISLKHPKPPVWRRVLVPGDYTFKDLHFVIQSVMNWTNTHMHKFDLKDPLTGEEIEVGGCGDLGFNKWVPESTKLYSYFKKENQKATYDYDFGSTWYHIILLEKILPADRTKKYPQCITGRRNTPPEDISPYDELKDFDPEFFDAKLFTFKKCRDFLKGDEVQIKDLSSDECASNSSNFSDIDIIQNENTSSEVDSEEIASSPELATSRTKSVEQQKVIDIPLTQNSNEKVSSVLPQKRKVSEDEVLKSIPAKLIALENKGIQKNDTPGLEMTKVIENSESDSSNSKSHTEDINVLSVTEDAEDYYGKFIASQMRDIKDLKRRDDLRIEIQQLISKYRFEN